MLETSIPVTVRSFVSLEVSRDLFRALLRSELGYTNPEADGLFVSVDDLDAWDLDAAPGSLRDVARTAHRAGAELVFLIKTEKTDG